VWGGRGSKARVEACDKLQTIPVCEKWEDKGYQFENYLALPNDSNAQCKKDYIIDY
jgi:hypothetical protein